MSNFSNSTSRGVLSAAALSLSALGFSSRAQAENPPSWAELRQLSTEVAKKSTSSCAAAADTLRDTDGMLAKADRANLPIAPSTGSRVERDLRNLEDAMLGAGARAYLTMQAEIAEKYRAGQRELRSQSELRNDLTKLKIEYLAATLGVPWERSVKILEASQANSQSISRGLGREETAPSSEGRVGRDPSIGRRDALFQLGAINMQFSAENVHTEAVTKGYCDRASAALCEYTSLVDPEPPDSCGFENLKEAETAAKESDGVEGKAKEIANDVLEKSAEKAFGKLRDKATKVAVERILDLFKYSKSLAGPLIKGVSLGLTGQYYETGVGSDFASETDRMVAAMLSQINGLESGRHGGGPDYSNPGLGDGSGGFQRDGGIKGVDTNDGRFRDRDNPGGIGNVG